MIGMRVLHLSQFRQNASVGVGLWGGDIVADGLSFVDVLNGLKLSSKSLV